MVVLRNGMYSSLILKEMEHARVFLCYEMEHTRVFVVVVVVFML